jgi:hypothetical protein
MRYFVLEPEVAAELGSRTIMDRGTHPPKVAHLHVHFAGWLGDALLETFPCFVVARELAEALDSSDLGGFILSDVEVSQSEEFHELHPAFDLPAFRWLRVTGRASLDDFGLSPDLRLIVSERALDLLRIYALAHADVQIWNPRVAST